MEINDFKLPEHIKKVFVDAGIDTFEKAYEFQISSTYDKIYNSDVMYQDDEGNMQINDDVFALQKFVNDIIVFTNCLMLHTKTFSKDSYLKLNELADYKKMIDKLKN